MIDFDRIDVISFDCYGTLIDWESGILGALASFRSEYRDRASDDELLEQYASLESVMESGEYIPYRDVLRGVMRGFARRFSVPEERLDPDLLLNSLPSWRPFPDTVESLRRLKQQYKLAVISNTDDDLFAQTARALEVPFDFVVTAEQVRAYKPSPRNFAHALEVFGIAKERLLHAAQSRYHDVAPARSLGVATVWVNRRAGKQGEGATALSSAVPDLEVPDLRTLADRAAKSS
ncbi:MAG TPA: haloacid dehalogenase type II [Candidatus Krumholzibacteria bacterium]|nr:haloacid dehalogenase type II [Candidatus Krumholzibacteria bacterium]